MQMQAIRGPLKLGHPIYSMLLYNEWMNEWMNDQDASK